MALIANAALGIEASRSTAGFFLEKIEAESPALSLFKKGKRPNDF